MVDILSTPATPQADTDWRRALRGSVHLPGDVGYLDACAAWNRAVQQRPIAVVEPADVDDVSTLVEIAGRRGWRLTAQPGGHGANGDLSGTVLVRTGRLDEIWVDADLGVARVGAGVRWGQLLTALNGTGRIALAGSNADVTVVGYLLGGGLSWFGRRYGVAARTLRAVEIVDATAQPRWVTDDDPDLMWALRGGGGSFGIVTRVEIDLPSEPRLHGGKLTFPISHAADVLEAFSEITRSADDGLTCWATILHFPDLPTLPDHMRAQSFITVDLTHLGDGSRLDPALDRLRQAAPLLSDTVAPIQIGDLHAVAAEPTEPTPFLDWSTALTSLDTAAIRATLASVADRSRTAVSVVQIRHLDAALATGDPRRPGAFDHLDGRYLLYAFGVPATLELHGSIAASLRDLAASTRPFATGRTAPTFLGAGMTLDDAFDPSTLRRLKSVKSRNDPHHLFDGNRPL